MDHNDREIIIGEAPGGLSAAKNQQAGFDELAVRFFSKPAVIEVTEMMRTNWLVQRITPSSELFGPNLAKRRMDLTARVLADERERDLERMLYGDRPRRPTLAGLFKHPVVEINTETPDWLTPTIEGYNPDETVKSYPGGEALEAAGWEFMLVVTKPTAEMPWLPLKVWARRWQRDGDHDVPLDHARVVRGRYRDRLPTNRRRKRERAKERRRARGRLAR